jgi:hypothetical protein
MRIRRMLEDMLTLEGRVSESVPLWEVEQLLPYGSGWGAGYSGG